MMWGTAIALWTNILSFLKNKQIIKIGNNISTMYSENKIEKQNSDYPYNLVCMADCSARVLLHKANAFSVFDLLIRFSE